MVGPSSSMVLRSTVPHPKGFARPVLPLAALQEDCNAASGRFHHLYSNPTFSPCAQKSEPLKLNAGRAGPPATGGAIWLTLTVRSICVAGRTTLLQYRKL